MNNQDRLNVACSMVLTIMDAIEATEHIFGNGEDTELLPLQLLSIAELPETNPGTAAAIRAVSRLVTEFNRANKELG
jgi:hypothetical protein